MERTNVKKKYIKSDLKKIDAMKNSDIDYSDIEELDESFFTKVTVLTPPTKEQLTVRFDRDIVSWFREQGRGYQTRMNAVLRAYVSTHKNQNNDIHKKKQK